MHKAILQILNYKLESMGKRCGRWPENALSLPIHIAESPYNLTVLFISDGSETFPGFRAKWTILTPESMHCTRVVIMSL